MLEDPAVCMCAPTGESRACSEWHPAITAEGPSASQLNPADSVGFELHLKQYIMWANCTGSITYKLLQTVKMNFNCKPKTKKKQRN